MAVTNIKPVDSIEEVFGMVVSPEQGLRNIFSFISSMRDITLPLTKYLLSQTMYPCGVVLYLQRLHGVMKAVRWRPSSWRGTLS